MTMLNRVLVIDYGMGNLDSIRRALEECGGNVVISSDLKEFKRATHIVLPGVGAFSVGMKNLEKKEIVSSLKEEVLNKKVPFLGICLGMQLLADVGFEGGETNGLGLIKGEVKLLPKTEVNIRIPHVGWNEVLIKKENPLFKDISSGRDFYFVHSYHLACAEEKDVIAYTDYACGFVSAMQKENIFGVQFHPEKSQKAGFQLLRNFLTLC